jgi:hypothetical protein
MVGVASEDRAAGGVEVMADAEPVFFYEEAPPSGGDATIPPPSSKCTLFQEYTDARRFE